MTSGRPLKVTARLEAGSIAAVPGAPGFATETAEKARGATEKAVDKSGSKFGDAIEKGIDYVDEKSKHKHTEKLRKAEGKLKDGLDGLDGKNDDIPDARRR